MIIAQLSFQINACSAAGHAFIFCKMKFLDVTTCTGYTKQEDFRAGASVYNQTVMFISETMHVC
jgi:hypothetical protein